MDAECYHTRLFVSQIKGAIYTEACPAQVHKGHKYAPVESDKGKGIYMPLNLPGLGEIQNKILLSQIEKALIGGIRGQNKSLF